MVFFAKKYHNFGRNGICGFTRENCLDPDDKQKSAASSGGLHF